MVVNWLKGKGKESWKWGYGRSYFKLNILCLEIEHVYQEVGGAVKFLAKTGAQVNNMYDCMFKSYLSR